MDIFLTTESGVILTTESLYPLTLEQGVADMPGPLFFVAELTAFKPGSGTFNPSQGHGSHPHGAMSEIEDTIQSTTTIYVSDMGYVTLNTDPQGAMPYPPIIDGAFQIDRRQNLDPGKSSVAASWGSLNLSNADGQFNSIVTDWNSDNRALRILYGIKTWEDYPGSRTARSTAGSYQTINGVVGNQAVGLVRYDYAPAVIATGARANMTPNSEAVGAVAGSPGTVPTGWQVLAPAGMTRTVVTPNGVSPGGLGFLEILMTGTPTAQQSVRPQNTPGIPAYQGETWTFSINIALTGGDWTNCAPRIRIWGINAAQAQSEVHDLLITPTTAAFDGQRYTCTFALTNAATRQVMGSFEPTYTLSTPINHQFQIGAAQLEKTAAPTAYIPTRQTGNGTIGSPTVPPVPLNEPAATNFCTNSSTMSAWNGTGSANQNWVNSATNISPANVFSVFILQPTVITTQVVAVRLVNVVTNGATVTFSVFAKSFGIPKFTLRCAGGSTVSGGSPNANFDLTGNGSVVSVDAGCSATLTRWGNEWFRASFTYPLTAVAANPTFVIQAADAVQTNAGVMFWGAQVEEGPAATSYIATAGSTVTRAADGLTSARKIMLDPPYSSLLPAFIGVARPWFLTDTELQVPLRDVSYFTEIPLQSSIYGGTGTYDGTAALVGKPKPKARGGTSGNPILNVTPTLLDPVQLIYQYNDCAGTVVHAYEGGAIVWTYAGDTTNLYAGTTPAGQYRTDNSRGLFQLGSQPQRTVTIDCTGQFPSGGVVTQAAQIALHLLTEDLVVPSANVLASSFTAAAGDPAIGVAGLYWGSDSAIDGPTAVDQVVTGFGGQIIPNRAGQLQLFLLRAIPATASPAIRFDLTNTVAVIPQALPESVQPPAYRVRVNYQTNHTVMTSGVSPSATAAQQQYVATAGPSAAFVSTAVLQAWLRPNDIGPLDSALLAAADATNAANNYGALWGVRRRLYAVTVPSTMALAREIGDIVMLVWPMDNLIGGQLGQVIGETWTSTDATIDLFVLV